MEYTMDKKSIKKKLEEILYRKMSDKELDDLIEKMPPLSEQILNDLAVQMNGKNVFEDLTGWIKKCNAMMVESASVKWLQPLKIIILTDLFNKWLKDYKKNHPKELVENARYTVDDFYKSIGAKTKNFSLDECRRMLYENEDN